MINSVTENMLVGYIKALRFLVEIYETCDVEDTSHSMVPTLISLETWFDERYGKIEI